MYYPGSSGWLLKYFDLIEKQKISLRSTPHKDILSLSRDNGLLFGVANSFIYTSKSITSRWTSRDCLKSLFFESLLWVHIDQYNHNFNQEKFLNDLVNYYSQLKPKNTFDFLSFFKKETTIDFIETAIEERIELDRKFLETRIWLSALNNAFLFLDVLLFKEFLETKTIKPIQSLTYLTMKAFINLAHIDEELREQETKLFTYFLACSRLDEKADEQLQNEYTDLSYKPNLNRFKEETELFKKYLLYFCSFVLSSNREVNEKERYFLTDFAKELGLLEEEVDVALTYNTGFLLTQTKQIPYLGSSATDILFSNLYQRWSKILLRNKDKLVTEIQQSKELMILLAKSSKKELTAEEKELVKNQLLDIMKTMPSLAIFLIPGGSLLLPIFLKIIPSLLPSAFRDNEV